VKEGKFIDVNAAFERRYGYSRAEVLGRITAYFADRIQFEGQSCILADSEDLLQVDPQKSN
jgi:PAS domain S-box-containing protein